MVLHRGNQFKTVIFIAILDASLHFNPYMISKIDGACLLLECFSLSVIVLVIENSIQLGKPSKKDGTTGNGWFNAILS